MVASLSGQRSYISNSYTTSKVTCSHPQPGYRMPGAFVGNANGMRSEITNCGWANDVNGDMDGLGSNSSDIDLKDFGLGGRPKVEIDRIIRNLIK